MDLMTNPNFKTNAVYLKMTLFFCLIFLFSIKGYSQCKEEQETLDNIQKEYNVLFVDLEKQSEELKKIIPDTTSNDSGTPGHHISFDVKMKPQKISFDLIEVAMKTKTMSLNLPQVTMKTKSFSVPTSKAEWKVKKICCGLKTKVLVITNGMKKVSFKFPETKMNRTEIITKIPEFTKKRKDISFKIPEFKMKSPVPEEGEFKELQEKTDEITKQAALLNEAGVTLEKDQKEKAKIAVTGLFNCINKELNAQKIQTENSFQESIVQLNTAIEEVIAHGLNPEQIKGDDGTVTNLYKAKEELIKGHEETVNDITAAIKEIEEQQQKIEGELSS